MAANNALGSNTPSGALGQLAGNAQLAQQHAMYQAMAAGYYNAVGQPQVLKRPLQPDKYIAAALQGLMSREASYLFKYDEMAKEAWDLAEAMAKEAQTRGY